MADAKKLRLATMPYWPTNSTGNLGTFTLDATTDALEFVFNSQSDAAVTRLGVYVSARTGAQPTYQISLQGVDASGNPDGTIKGGGSPASATFTPSADGWLWVTLANSYTPARGDFLALVVKYSSGTIGGSNNTAFAARMQNLDGTTNRFPYHIENNAGSRSRSNATSRGVFAYGGAATAFGFPANGSLASENMLGNAGESLALKHTLPADWGDTYKLAGIKICGGFAAGGANDVIFRLYSGTTVLQSVTLDPDAQQSAASVGDALIYFDEATLSTLSFGSTYRVGVADDTVNGSHTLRYLPLAASGDADAFPLGTDACLSYFDGSAWTDMPTRRSFVDLILADWTEPAGGSSGPVGRVVGARSIGTY